MKELYGEMPVRKKITGWEFVARSIYSDGYEYKIQVDTKGNIVFADFGSDRGWCSNTPNDPQFEETVHMAMNGILENNKAEFMALRSHLNEKYRKMAENIRDSKMVNYDF